MSSTISGALLIVATNVAVLMPFFCVIPLLVHNAAAVSAKHNSREQPHFIIAVGPLTLLAKFLHPLPGFQVDDRLMCVLKNHLLVLWIEDAHLDLVGNFLCLEVDGMAQVLPPFQNMAYSVCRPFTRVVRIVAPGTASAPVLHRPWRGNVLLGQHPGDLRGAVSGKAQTVNLLDYGRCFLINDECTIFAFEVAVHRLAGDRLSTHALGTENRLDLFARVLHHPFVEQIFQRT